MFPYHTHAALRHFPDLEMSYSGGIEKGTLVSRTIAMPFMPIDPEHLTLDSNAAKALGESKAAVYQAGEPYHHTCIDDFLPMEVIEKVRADLDSLPEAERSFEGAEEKLKSQYSPDRLPDYSRGLFHTFNSRAFILFLEEMTGIKGLIPDPYFAGAGIHKTLNGGYLNIHADFNVHKKMRVERRLNVLIYLNPPWQEDWGGSFEVWDKEMTKKVASFAPTENRMVCFSTGSDTFHGNPEPVNHPDGLPRQSIALYYYTATWDESRLEHTTIFKPRPGSSDHRQSTGDKVNNVAREWLPPKVYRAAKRLGL